MTLDSALPAVTARTRLQPALAALKLITPSAARANAGLHDVDEHRRMCNRVMRALGFELKRLGRVEFYVRQTPPEKHDDQPGSRAAARAIELAAARSIALREQLERRELQHEREPDRFRRD